VNFLGVINHCSSCVGTEAVVSSTGTYLVKMAKRGNGVGISISCKSYVLC